VLVPDAQNLGSSVFQLAQSNECDQGMAYPGQWPLRPLR
jgi:hypothetical protein